MSFFSFSIRFPCKKSHTRPFILSEAALTPFQRNMNKVKGFEQSKAEARAAAVIAAISRCGILWNVFNADRGATITGTSKVTSFLTWICDGNSLGSMANTERTYSKNQRLLRCSLWRTALTMTSSDNNDLVEKNNLSDVRSSAFKR